MAAGFYKFIKILEYETANPDQDMDHAAKVQRKKNLLMEAGINETDAQQVAKELQANAGVTEKREYGNGGPDSQVMANGQGRSSQEADRQGMYGTNFRASGSSDQTAAAQTEQPPLSQPGQYTHLGKAGRQPSMGERTDSPAIASQDAIFAPHFGPNEGLGDMVTPEPRNRFARTASSGV